MIFHRIKKYLLGLLIAVAILALAGFGLTSQGRQWLGRLSGWESEVHADEHDHDAHGDEHAASPGTATEILGTTIQLSRQAAQNIGLKTVKATLQPYQRTIEVPAIVVERPGHSQIDVTTPLTGVVEKVFPIAGQAVSPGDPLFEIRLTHEELVLAQGEFLQSLEELDVEQRELERLQSVTDGVVAGKTILAQQYTIQKLQSVIHALEQRLLLHGLSADQVERIRATRSLIARMTVRAPEPLDDDDVHSNGQKHLFHIQEILVRQGEQTDSGDTLCVLADHCRLLIEGRAFEDDASRLTAAAERGEKITALFYGDQNRPQRIDDLRILYLADSVDPETRALYFYAELPNHIVRDQTDPNGRRFVQWEFRPGRRMNLLIPFDRWEDRIVLPLDALVDEGPDSYVFVLNGSRFEQKPVHIEYRDRQNALVAADGSLFPGDTVAVAGSLQMYLAIRNAGGSQQNAHVGCTH